MSNLNEAQKTSYNIIMQSLSGKTVWDAQIILEAIHCNLKAISLVSL